MGYLVGKINGTVTIPLFGACAVDLAILRDDWTMTLVELGPRWIVSPIRAQTMPTTGNIKLPDNTGTYLGFRVLDSRGNPVPLDETTAAVNSSDVNIAVASLVTTLDGHPEVTPSNPFIKVEPTGKLGTVQINASIPLAGGGQLTATATLDIVPGGASVLEMVPTGINFPVTPPTA